MAPEQIFEEASTPESDIFSLGCCFAWVHSVLSSKPWEEGKENEQGPSQLDELVGVGFASATGEVPSLLQRLRMDQESPKRPETVEFLFTMEEMITGMLIATPSERAKLESLLEQLNTYTNRCLLFKKQKAIYLCITTGRTTIMSEVDVSDISTDYEFFKLIRGRIWASHDYPKLLGLTIFKNSLGIDDVRFIKFIVYDRVFGVLEGPCSLPPTLALEAGLYEYHPSPSNAVPVPRDIFINMLSCSSSDKVWFDRIPKKVQVLGHHKSSLSGLINQPSEGKKIPKNIGWGIEIVIDTNAYLAILSSLLASLFLVVTIALNTHYIMLWWRGSTAGTGMVTRVLVVVQWILVDFVSMQFLLFYTRPNSLMLQTNRSNKI